MIRRLATGVLAVYIAWIDEDGPDRTIVGGILLSLILTNIIVLSEVFTEPQLAGLVVDLGVVGETTVFGLMGWMVVWYIFRPVRVLTRARESRHEIEAWLVDEVQQ